MPHELILKINMVLAHRLLSNQVHDQIPGLVVAHGIARSIANEDPISVVPDFKVKCEFSLVKSSA